MAKWEENILEKCVLKPQYTGGSWMIFLWSGKTPRNNFIIRKMRPKTLSIVEVLGWYLYDLGTLQGRILQKKINFAVLVYGHVNIIIMVILRSQNKITDFLWFYPGTVNIILYYTRQTICQDSNLDQSYAWDLCQFVQINSFVTLLTPKPPHQSAWSSRLMMLLNPWRHIVALDAGLCRRPWPSQIGGATNTSSVSTPIKTISWHDAILDWSKSDSGWVSRDTDVPYLLF